MPKSSKLHLAFLRSLYCMFLIACSCYKPLVYLQLIRVSAISFADYYAIFVMPIEGNSAISMLSCNCRASRAAWTRDWSNCAPQRGISGLEAVIPKALFHTAVCFIRESVLRRRMLRRQSAGYICQHLIVRGEDRHEPSSCDFNFCILRKPYRDFHIRIVDYTSVPRNICDCQRHHYCTFIPATLSSTVRVRASRASCLIEVVSV